MNSNFPVLYDDIGWRIVATVLCAVLALRRRWPSAAQPYYFAYSYFTIFYCLAFLLPLTMLHNKAATPTVVNMIWSAALIVLLTDWRNTIIVLSSGYALSVAVFWATVSTPHLPIDFILWWIPMCGVLVACGSISKYVEKRAELERMRRLYAGLAGSVAHEMRTPLAQIQHVFRCIEAEVSPDSEAARLVRQGHSAIQRGLQSITITLRQVSHRKPAPLELRPLSAEQCARKALDEYAYDSPEARECVHLRVEEDFHFQGDATTFELMLFNLLKNALYYLPVRPTMEIGVTVKTTPTTCIVVRDTGPGIPPDVLSRLFQEFQTHGKAEGTGLGLAFCYRTIHEWGGAIACRSEHGHFTEFTINLPSCPSPAPAPAQAAPAMPEPMPSLKGHTVLIVDDIWFNRSVARTVTASLGMTVLEAEHGQQALDMLQGGAMPDIVLMDMSMPGLDGMSTTRRLRALPGAAGRVPVLALTADDSADVLAEAREAGMQGVLGKPIDVDALTTALRTSLNQTSSHSLRV
ncbi:MAG: response regulator [Hydrogenophaga sp.]|uniref:hybrid sensor histidine kinase/response regulator n=1 Tax=Hydrogenophaga sp. TaxID=1904254 RepID=UPI0025C499CC|nr:response regulator [Hydrogenophaga sp.]MBU7575073.1 response regulator [Hydrogenophaga sp.]